MDRKPDERKLHMKKADILLVIVCLLAAAALTVCFFIGREDGQTLRISYDGETVLRVEWKEHIWGDGGVYYLITYGEDGAVSARYEERPDDPEGMHYNLVYISAENVKVEAADCKDQICVHHRPISGGGESIICLPHRLVVEVVPDGKRERMDGMVK